MFEKKLILLLKRKLIPSVTCNFASKPESIAFNVYFFRSNISYFVLPRVYYVYFYIEIILRVFPKLKIKKKNEKF